MVMPSAAAARRSACALFNCIGSPGARSAARASSATRAASGFTCPSGAVGAGKSNPSKGAWSCSGARDSLSGGALSERASTGCPDRRGSGGLHAAELRANGQSLLPTLCAALAPWAQLVLVRGPGLRPAMPLSTVGLHWDRWQVLQAVQVLQPHPQMDHPHSRSRLLEPVAVGHP